MDFKNGKLVKLGAAPDDTYSKLLAPMLAGGEKVRAVFRGIRDGVVFTDTRLILVSVEGVGVRKEITSLPYRQIQAYSVKTAGVFDIDAELELSFCGIGEISLEFAGNADMGKVCRLISESLKS